MMQCPRCGSTHIRKNGKKQGKQNHICVDCHRQFINVYHPKGYSNDIKQNCLKLYVNGMGFRAIERVTGVHHTTVIYWIKQVGEQLRDAPSSDKVPQVGELDELETFVGSKKTKSGCGRRLITSNQEFWRGCWVDETPRRLSHFGNKLKHGDVISM